jgi:hypothetical protein
MEWIRQDRGITEDNGVWIIPYPPPKPKHLPLAEEVLLSIPFMLPQKITLKMAVRKEQLSTTKWQEFAVFLADDVETWKGREVGFRFPFNKDSNTCTFYLQYPIVSQPYIQDKFVTVPELKKEMEDLIEFEKVYWNIYRVKFNVDASGSTPISQTAYGWFPKTTFR